MMEGFGKRLRELRGARGLSQEAVANVLGISPQSVSKWETGRSLPDLSYLLPLSALLHVSADELLGNEPPEQRWESEWKRLILAGDPVQAVKTAMEALEYLQGQPHLLYRLAEAEYFAGRMAEGAERRRFYEAAENHYRAVLRQLPEFEGALRKLALLLAEQERRGEAEALARKLPDPEETLLLVLRGDAWREQRRRVLSRRALSFWEMLQNLDPELAERFLLDYPWDERDRIDFLSSLCLKRAEKLCIQGDPDAAMEALKGLWDLSRRMEETKARPPEEREEVLFLRLREEEPYFGNGMLFAFHTIRSPVLRPLEGREDYRRLLELADRQMRIGNNAEEEAE